MFINGAGFDGRFISRLKAFSDEVFIRKGAKVLSSNDFTRPRSTGTLLINFKSKLVYTFKLAGLEGFTS